MAVKVDRRVRRTRRLLSEAFIELVAEQGYDAVRVEDILERADIARTTFYAHFRDKRDLLQFVAATFQETLQERLAEIQIDATGLPSAEQLVETFTNIKSHAPFFRMALSANSVPLLYEKIHQGIVATVDTLLTQHVEEQGIETAVPTSLVAHYFAGAILSSVKWWLQEQRIYLISPEEMAAHFVQLREVNLLQK